MKLLFCCYANQNRAPTFAEWFNKNTSHEAKSCALLSFFDGRNDQINNEIFDWADHVYVMTNDIREDLIKKGYDKSKIFVIGVEDVYDKNEPALIKIVREFAKKIEVK